MAANGREELEQRLIDHEVRLTRAREAGELYAAGRDARQDQRSSAADRRWYREQLVSILKAARSEEDLEGLGLTDEVMREARLGNSVREAWTQFHFIPPRIARPGQRSARFRPSPPGP